MTELSNISPFCRRLLANMSPDIAKSLNAAQLAEIQAAIEIGERRDHPVDIRFSLPLIWRRFAIVLLVTPERRSPERRTRDRAKHLLWSFGNAVVYALFVLATIPIVIGTIRMLLT